VLVVLILLETRAASYAAVVVFAVGAASDWVDGFVARRYGTVTRTGQWLDPLSDKLLVVVPALVLTAIGAFPVWAAVVIALREVAVLALRAFVGTRGRPMPASKLAKWKTTAQIAAMTLYLLPLGHGAHPVRLAVLIVAVALTVYTGLDYLVRETGLVGRAAVPRKGRAG
jgi:CDP-diacylglycerol---glycerol-3-phosphate 3-phosphatidyltransferase